MFKILPEKAVLNFARIALAVIYIWFGALKILGLSPASLLVQQLYEKTIPVIPFPSFYVIFALFEVAVGMLFLIPKLTRIAFVLLVVHLFTTALPLFLLPLITWQRLLVPTLEGQYIIKNIALLALGMVIYTNAEKLKTEKK